MASSAPPPKDWRRSRTAFVLTGLATGVGYVLWGTSGSAAGAAVPIGATCGAVGGYLAYRGFRWLVRRLYRALAPRMRPDRLS